MYTHITMMYLHFMQIHTYVGLMFGAFLCRKPAACPPSTAQWRSASAKLCPRPGCSDVAVMVEEWPWKHPNGQLIHGYYWLIQGQ